MMSDKELVNMVAVKLITERDEWRQRAEAAEQEQRISAHELALIEPHTTRGITDASTPLHIRVQNIVAQLEAAESQWRTASYVCHDQTERLAKLTAERDALRAEVEECRTALRVTGAVFASAVDECDALRAEVETLRQRAEAAERASFCACGHPKDAHSKADGYCLGRGRGEGWTYDPCGCGGFTPRQGEGQ